MVVVQSRVERQRAAKSGLRAGPRMRNIRRKYEPTWTEWATDSAYLTTDRRTAKPLSSRSRCRLGCYQHAHFRAFRLKGFRNRRHGKLHRMRTHRRLFAGRWRAEAQSMDSEHVIRVLKGNQRVRLGARTRDISLCRDRSSRSESALMRTHTRRMSASLQWPRHHRSIRWPLRATGLKR